ncbi:unnamed protein product [Closterium sp. NIES-64]|nr:unnamed protein product [Closterium sp. NIES-64]
MTPLASQQLSSPLPLPLPLHQCAVTAAAFPRHSFRRVVSVRAGSFDHLSSASEPAGSPLAQGRRRRGGGAASANDPAAEAAATAVGSRGDPVTAAAGAADTGAVGVDRNSDGDRTDGGGNGGGVAPTSPHRRAVRVLRDAPPSDTTRRRDDAAPAAAAAPAPARGKYASGAGAAGRGSRYVRSGARAPTGAAAHAGETASAGRLADAAGAPARRLELHTCLSCFSHIVFSHDLSSPHLLSSSSHLPPPPHTKFSSSDSPAPTLLRPVRLLLSPHTPTPPFLTIPKTLFALPLLPLPLAPTPDGHAPSTAGGQRRQAGGARKAFHPRPLRPLRSPRAAAHAAAPPGHAGASSSSGGVAAAAADAAAQGAAAAAAHAPAHVPTAAAAGRLSPAAVAAAFAAASSGSAGDAAGLAAGVGKAERKDEGEGEGNGEGKGGEVEATAEGDGEGEMSGISRMFALGRMGAGESGAGKDRGTGGGSEGGGGGGGVEDWGDMEFDHRVEMDLSVPADVAWQLWVDLEQAPKCPASSSSHPLHISPSTSVTPSSLPAGVLDSPCDAAK